jgi:hypothetical protein
MLIKVEVTTKIITNTNEQSSAAFYNELSFKLAFNAKNKSKQKNAKLYKKQINARNLFK